MTLRQIELVQATYPSLRPIAGQAVALFYVRLFELAPALRPLFHGELGRQGRRLGELLPRLVQADPGLAQWLGADSCARLSRLAASDCAAVETALLWTLRQVLGEAFSAEVEGAWAALFGRLVAEVRQAAGPGDRAA